jgi:hypothetical protein
VAEKGKENEIIPLNQNALAKISLDNVELPKLFSEDIFLEKQVVAGTTHLEDVQAVEDAVDIGTRVALVREVDNKYDKRAILVFRENSPRLKLGYIPRRKNTILANLMDAGKKLYGIVDEKEWDGVWLKIFIKVYMED